MSSKRLVREFGAQDDTSFVLWWRLSKLFDILPTLFTRNVEGELPCFQHDKFTSNYQIDQAIKGICDAYEGNATEGSTDKGEMLKKWERVMEQTIPEDCIAEGTVKVARERSCRNSNSRLANSTTNPHFNEHIKGIEG